MKSFSFQNFLKIGFFTLLLSVIAFFTQEKLKWRDLWKKPVSHSATKTESTFSPSILNLSEAIQTFHDPETIFLDVREKKYYDYGHIQKALNLPLTEMQNPDAKILELLKKARTIVIYCNGIGCGSAFHAARHLHSLGIENPQVYSEGWPEWRLCRLPIDASPELKKELVKERGEK